MALASSFVGRSRELAILREALDDAIAGRGGLLALVGDAGIGKTRIATELGHEARARGVQVAWGRCREDETPTACWPWAQVLRTLGAPALDATAAPAFALPGQARLQLFEEAIAHLRAAAAARPALIVLDDLHWADLSSLLLLELAAPEVSDAGILFVVTFRPAEVVDRPAVARVLGNLARVGRTVPLRGLAGVEIAELIEHRAGARPSDALVATLQDVTDGNPFFLLELASLLPPAALTAGGDATSPLAVGIPLGIRELVRQRVAPLPERCARILRTAAVMGREFDLAPLARLLGLDAAALLDALEPALRLGLVRAVPDALRRHAFAHALIREALYDDLEAAARVRLHREVGEAIEATAGGQLEAHVAELAHHFFAGAQAGDPAKAVHYGRRAGDSALAQAGYEEAIAHYSRALQADDLGTSGDPDERLEILCGLGEGAAGVGDLGRVAEVFHDAFDLARHRGTQAFARTVARFGAVRSEMGVLDEELIALLEEAIRDLPPDDGALRAVLMARLASALHLQPKAAERRRTLADTSATVARRLDDPGLLAYVLCHRLIALLGPDNLAERLASEDEVLALARSSGHRPALLSALVFRVHDLLEHGDHAGFLAAVDQVERLAGEFRQPFYLWHAATFRATIALIEGRQGDAEALMAEALRLGQRAQSQSAMLHYGQQLIQLRAEQGRLVELLPLVEASAAEAATVPAWRCSLADLYCLVEGRRDAAARELDALAVEDFATIPRDTSWLVAIALLANVCAELGDQRRAAVLYDLLLPYAGLIATSRPAVVAVQPIDTQLGRLATVMRRYDDAERHFERALELAARMRGTPWQLHARVHYADMLLERAAAGDAERTAAMLAPARASAEATGYTLVLGWISLRIARAEAMARDEALQLRSLAQAGRERAAGQRATVVHLVPQTRDSSREPPKIAAAAPAACPVSRRRGAFLREGAIWTLALDGKAIRLRHSVGLAHIAHLLLHPGRQFQATDLIGLERGAAGDDALRPAAERSPDARGNLGDAGELLDERAKLDYRRRLRELEAELEEATGFNDLGRAERLREEIEFVRRELVRAIGLGGRDRRAGSASERARVTVAKAIKYTLGKIAAEDTALAEHLESAIRTGHRCSYDPPARDQVLWTLG